MTSVNKIRAWLTSSSPMATSTAIQRNLPTATQNVYGRSFNTKFLNFAKPFEPTTSTTKRALTALGRENVRSTFVQGTSLLSVMVHRFLRIGPNELVVRPQIHHESAPRWRFPVVSMPSTIQEPNTNISPDTDTQGPTAVIRLVPPCPIEATTWSTPSSTL